MAEHYRRFPTPPSNIPLEIERESDRIVVRIKQDRAVARQILARSVPASVLIFWPILRYSIAPTLLMMVGISALFVWVGTRVPERETKWFAFAIAGMHLVMLAVMLNWIRRGVSMPFILWRGKFPWRMELSHDCWQVVQPKVLFGEYRHQVRPSLVTRVYANAEARVIAYKGAQLMLISPPMLPEMAAWLSDALADQVGPHVLRDVAEDEAKFYTPS